MATILRYKMTGIARRSIKDKINAWCRKNSHRIRFGNVLALVQPVEIADNPDITYKLKLRNKPSNLFDIMISPGGIVNDKVYRYLFPDHYKLFCDLFNAHFRFVEMLAKGITFPIRYPQVFKFIKDFENGLISKFNDDRLNSSLKFLVMPSKLCLTRKDDLVCDSVCWYSHSTTWAYEVIENIRYFEQLYGNIKLLFDVIDDYGNHPLSKLMILQ